MATKKASGKKVNKKKVSDMQKKLSSVREKNGKLGVKKPYANNGTTVLLEAVSVALQLPVMPKSIVGNNEAMRNWCITNNAPSVQRNEVCTKATNYRADNAIRARIGILQEKGIIPASISYVWATNNAVAVRNPFTTESEKVFIVRK